MLGPPGQQVCVLHSQRPAAPSGNCVWKVLLTNVVFLLQVLHAKHLDAGACGGVLPAERWPCCKGFSCCTSRGSSCSCSASSGCRVQSEDPGCGCWSGPPACCLAGGFAWAPPCCSWWCCC